MKKTLFLLCCFFFLKVTACNERIIRPATIPEPLPTNPPVEKATIKKIKTIAFGSCNKTELPQRIWPTITQNKPDLWVWLGDIIYSDTENMDKLARNYRKQKLKPLYQEFIKNCPVIGIYDDHDYGENDGGKSYPRKKESKALLLDFLDVDSKNSVWKREGAYQSYTYGEAGEKVKVILLDTRYFRDEMIADPSGKQRYLPNENGTILGEKQWKWLEKELTNSDAQVHIIGSSIQVIPKDHRFEKWANFPSERNQLLRLIQKTKPEKTILISGDRHISEISKIALTKLPYSLYEITSSSLTHAYRKKEGETNQYRVGKLVDINNFSLLVFDWRPNGVEVTVEIRGAKNELLETQRLF